jgi:flagellar protein FliO/FliZ
MTIQTIISTCAALAGVVFLLLFGGRIAQKTRFARPNGAGRIRIEETLALDARRRLLLVSCNGRAVLLLTGAQDQVVGWLPEQAS